MKIFNNSIINFNTLLCANMGEISRLSEVVLGKKKLKIPFELSLNKSDHFLQCNKLLRFVPGRRAVFSGLWDKKRIIAKFFFKPFRYKNHVKKEIKGNYLFKQAKIPTSKILYSSFCDELKSHILIFEFIDNSTSLKQIFEFDNSKKSNDLMIIHKKHLVSLVRLIGKIHEKGIIHNDLHPDNFLLKNDTIYALDGASIKLISTRPLKKKISLENLAIILSQIDTTANTKGEKKKNLLYDFADAYAKKRNYKKKDQIAKKLETLIKKSHRSRIAKYLKKIYRRSTQIVCKKSFSSFVLCQRKYYTPAMESFLRNPDIAFYNPGNSLLKAGNTATIVRYKIDEIELVVKRYNMKNRFHTLRLAFKKSRADISWRSAHLLIKNQINTPEPVAIKEIRFEPFRNRAFFICEYIKGESARSFFTNVQNAHTDKVKIPAESIINLFYKLKSLMISHGDMKATNIIMQKGKPFFIDLDSMTWHKTKFMFSHAWKKDINRFMKNWKNTPQTARLFKKLQE